MDYVSTCPQCSQQEREKEREWAPTFWIQSRCDTFYICLHIISHNFITELYLNEREVEKCSFFTCPAKLLRVSFVLFFFLNDRRREEYVLWTTKTAMYLLHKLCIFVPVLLSRKFFSLTITFIRTKTQGYTGCTMQNLHGHTWQSYLWYFNAIYKLINADSLVTNTTFINMAFKNNFQEYKDKISKQISKTYRIHII